MLDDKIQSLATRYWLLLYRCNAFSLFHRSVVRYLGKCTELGWAVRQSRFTNYLGQVRPTRRSGTSFAKSVNCTPSSSLQQDPTRWEFFLSLLVQRSKFATRTQVTQNSELLTLLMLILSTQGCV